MARPAQKTHSTARHALTVELVEIASLQAHPRNYREHPDDQIAHLIQSIQDHGFYRNVVITQDNTILAGHGIVQAAQQLGYPTVPAVRLPLEATSPAAWKVLVGDNEMARLAMPDDRALTELLKEIKDMDLNGLLGTGFDEVMLAGLVFVSRPASEVRDKDEAAHWVGMPDYDEGTEPLTLSVKFEQAQDREDFLTHIGVSRVDKRTPKSWALWWPEKDRQDLSSVRFEG